MPVWLVGVPLCRNLRLLAFLGHKWLPLDCYGDEIYGVSSRFFTFLNAHFTYPQLWGHTL